MFAYLRISLAGVPCNTIDSAVKWLVFNDGSDGQYPIHHDRITMVRLIFDWKFDLFEIHIYST